MFVITARQVVITVSDRFLVIRQAKPAKAVPDAWHLPHQQQPTDVGPAFVAEELAAPQPAVLSVEGRIGIPQAPRRTVSRMTRLSLASTCQVSSTGRSKTPKLPWATTAVASSGGRAATRAASVTMAARAAASLVSPTIRSMPSAIRVSRAKAPSVARGSGSLRTAEKPKAARPAVAALPTEVPIETSLCNIRANENEGPKTLASWHEPALFPRPASTPSNRDPAAPRAGTCPPRRAARRARRPP